MSVAENESAPTSSVLFASHKHLQKRCSSQTAAYLACKKKSRPEMCLKEGAKVTG